MKLNSFISITKALSDASRVRALLSLQRGELCVCQIIALLHLAPSTVSKHMTILKHAGLVESRKEGRWIYFRLAGKEIDTHTKKTLNLVLDMLKNEKEVVNDRKDLQKILCSNTEDLCKAMRKN